MDISVIFGIVILILSIVAHEVAHGFAALKYGDRTALFAGRLTMNPIKHIDLIGSILLPLFLVIAHSPIGFGWAKPVPVNPNNFRPEKKREALFVVSIAGIFVNLLIAFIFGLFIRLGFVDTASSLFQIIGLIIAMNIGLACFNIIPIPPLDGSKVLFSILPGRFQGILAILEKNTFVVILLLLAVLQIKELDFLTPMISGLFTLFTGLH